MFLANFSYCFTFKNKPSCLFKHFESSDITVVKKKSLLKVYYLSLLQSNLSIADTWGSSRKCMLWPGVPYIGLQEVFKGNIKYSILRKLLPAKIIGKRLIYELREI